MRIVLLPLLTLGLVFCAATGSSIQTSITHDLVAQKITGEDLDAEPVYQPRWFWGGGKKEVNATTETKNIDGDDDDEGFSGILGGNGTLEKLLEALQNSGNVSLQENLLNLATTFGGNGTVGQIAELLKNSENETIQENIINLLSNTALSKFGGDETVKSILGVLQNPGNKTLQENLLNVATNAALSKFGDNEVVQNVANALKNPGNKTVQENLMSVATDVALSKFGDNEAVKNIANVLKNSGNKTLQENFANVAAEVALSKFGDNEAIKNIANVLKNSGNKTVQENLLNVATEAVLGKFGHNEAVSKIVDVMRNPGNQSIAQNVMSLAVDLAQSKFKNNVIVKSVANILHSKNGTIQEKLTAAADAALTNSLGPIGAAVAKQGINAVGQALKLGGGLFGGFLKKIGGSSVLGKVGDAITGGSHAVGGIMTTIASGPATSSAAAIESSKTAEIEKVAENGGTMIFEDLKPNEEKKVSNGEVVKEGVAAFNNVASQLDDTKNSGKVGKTENKIALTSSTSQEDKKNTLTDSSDGLGLSGQKTQKKANMLTSTSETSSSFIAGKSITEDKPDSNTKSNEVLKNGIASTSKTPESNIVDEYHKKSQSSTGSLLEEIQNLQSQTSSTAKGGNALVTAKVQNLGNGHSVSSQYSPVNYGSFAGENSGKVVTGLSGKAMNVEITTVKIHMGKK